MFTRLLPKTLRIARLYAKSTLISKDHSLSPKEKLERILIMEKKYGGREYFGTKAECSSTFAMARAIAKKDLGKLFIGIGAANVAIDYLLSAQYDCDFIKREQNINNLIETKVLTLMYLSVAYSKIGNLKRSLELFDQQNKYLIDCMSKAPSNSRLAELYRYTLKMAYNTILDYANTQDSKKVIVYSALKDLLTIFNQRDSGNDQIERYLTEL